MKSAAYAEHCSVHSHHHQHGRRVATSPGDPTQLAFWPGAGVHSPNCWVFTGGDRRTVADAYAFTIMRCAPTVGMSMKGLPNLQTYLARMEAFPAVNAALDAEGVVHA